ncbi:MAG: hypothetical protein M1821_000895 [Bathelium mastoideum]|nr:MAG: hypothetical protein M1821_000895 [Bathelium mastoideum]
MSDIIPSDLNRGDEVDSGSDDHEKLPERINFPDELRKDIDEECSLLERYIDVEKETHLRNANREAPTPDLTLAHKQELARVFCYIEQAQRLENRVALARVWVTAYYYQRYLQSIAQRAKERLASLEAQKQHLKIELAQVEDASVEGERRSRPGEPAGFERMRRLGEKSLGPTQEINKLGWWNGGIAQSTMDRAEGNGKSFWLPEEQFFRFIKGQQLEAEFQQEAKEAIALAQNFQAEVSNLRKEIDELRAQSDEPDIPNPDLLVEMVTLLTTQFPGLISDIEDFDGMSHQQKAIIKRLEMLTHMHYPGQDVQSLVRIGYGYLECLTPYASPGPSRSSAQNNDVKRNGSGMKRVKFITKDVDFAPQRYDETTPKMSNKEGKQPVRDLNAAGPSSATDTAKTVAKTKNQSMVLACAHPESEGIDDDAGCPQDSSQNGKENIGWEDECVVQGNAKGEGFAAINEITAIDKKRADSTESLKRTAAEMEEMTEAIEQNGAKRSRSPSFSCKGKGLCQDIKAVEEF